MAGSWLVELCTRFPISGSLFFQLCEMAKNFNAEDAEIFCAKIAKRGRRNLIAFG
jgi:hypothetical protein